MAGQKVHGAVNAALASLNIALKLRDPAITESFHKNAILIGSEQSDLSRGREAIAAHLGRIFARPYTIQFEWTSVEASRAGDTAWFFADGEVVIVAADGEQRRPYNLTGVLVETKRGWRWRLFHGSEPLAS